MVTSKGDYTISDERSDQQVERVHSYLARSYWAEAIPLDLVRLSIENSLCVGVFHHGLQVGFARVVTDRATFAYLCDVYVLEAHRHLGVAAWMMDWAMDHHHLQRLRRFLLVTRDAHRLYTLYGFKPLKAPDSFMEINRHGLYNTQSSRADK